MSSAARNEGFFFLLSHTTRISPTKHLRQILRASPSSLRRKRSSSLPTGEMETTRDMEEAPATSPTPAQGTSPTNMKLSSALASLGLSGVADPMAPVVPEPAAEIPAPDPAGDAAAVDTVIDNSSRPATALLSPVTGENVTGEAPISFVPMSTPGTKDRKSVV